LNKEKEHTRSVYM